MDFEEVGLCLKVGHLIAKLFLPFFEGMILASESITADLVRHAEGIQLIHLALDLLCVGFQSVEQFPFFLDGQVGLQARGEPSTN